MVLDYIREFGSITPLDAFRDLGITRLSAIVFRLREEGHDIDKAIEALLDTHPLPTAVFCGNARYSFGKGEINENQAR